MRVNWHTIAKSRWREKKPWITGSGRYALVVKCHQHRVYLYETLEQALFEAHCVSTGCGSRCAPQGRGRNHKVVDLAAGDPLLEMA